MKRKPENRLGTQGGVVAPVEKLRQLLLGMVAGMATAKQDLMQWVQELGMAALEEVFEADAVADRGLEGQHRPKRTHHRWGNDRDGAPVRRASDQGSAPEGTEQGRQGSLSSERKAVSGGGSTRRAGGEPDSAGHFDPELRGKFGNPASRGDEPRDE